MRIIRAALLLAAACGGSGSVAPERIAQLVAAGGDGQTGNAGTVIAVRVQALTASNAPAKGASVSFVVERGGGSATPATATVDAEGFASASWQLGTVAGAPQSLVASAPGIAATRFTATTTPGPPASVSIPAPSSDLFVAGTIQLTAMALDVYGNAIADASPPVWTSSKPEVASISSAGLATGLALGTAVFHATVGAIDGSRSVTVNGLVAGSGTPTVDGALADGEWSAASSLAVSINVPGGTAPGRLFVMNDDTNLYFALAFPRAVVDATSLAFEFDSNFDGILSAGDDGIILNSEIGSNDLVRFTGGTCPGNALCSGSDSTFGGTIDVAGAFHNDGTTDVYELSHPLDSQDPNDFALHHGSLIKANMSLRLLQRSTGEFQDTDFPGTLGSQWLQIAIR